MNKTKLQKGITLIALIITIVVLLVIAVVTIGVVQESGIIGHSQKAASEYKIAQEKEQIGIGYSEYIIEKNTSPNAQLEVKGAQVTAVGDAGWEVIFSETNSKYQLDKSGTITYIEEPEDVGEGENDEELAKYILGPDKTGRVLIGESGIIDTQLIFQQDPENDKSTIHEKVKFVKLTDTEMYIRYNRDIYKFNCLQGNNGISTLEKSLILVSSPNGNLGKYVTYANNTWIVLRDDVNGVELISANGLGEFEFKQSSYNEAKTNYNKALEIIVNKCKEESAPEIRSNIRSVGSILTEEEALSATNTVDFSEIAATTEFSPTVEDLKFAQHEGAINGLKKEDTNYEADYAQMETLGILVTDTPADYWLASRALNVRNGCVDFNVRFVNFMGELMDDNVYAIFAGSDKAFNGGMDARAFRPIVTLRSGILEGATQSGLIDDPIILD